LFPETHTPASRAYYAHAGESARRATRVIAVSHRTASDVVRLLGAEPSRVRVVHEAASPEFFPRPKQALEDAAARLHFDPRRPFVLAVGTLEPRKNHVLLLEAFAQLPRQSGVQLLLVGGRGWLDQPIFEAHARLHLESSAFFLGSLPLDDLAVLYSHAAVFAFPSLYEGFGLPLLEAMACGAPVVSSNAGPMPEVVGDAALLLPPEDPSQWADTLKRVLEDDALAHDLRARGRARAAAFSWERAARATRQVYREALLA
jgi:glycosyltransferase involved in cell wall biosynthesis